MPFQADLDAPEASPVYCALETKSIVLKTNSQGGVQANIGLWVETRTWQRFQAIPGRFRHPEDAPCVPCTRDQVDSIENSFVE